MIFHQNFTIYSYVRPVGTHNTPVEQVCSLNIGGAAHCTNELIKMIKTNLFVCFLLFLGLFICFIGFKHSYFVDRDPLNQFNHGGANFIHNSKS